MKHTRAFINPTRPQHRWGHSEKLRALAQRLRLILYPDGLVRFNKLWVRVHAVELILSSMNRDNGVKSPVLVP